MSSAFEKMSMIAFETIPLVREAKAVRRAMALFNEGRPAETFYISFVFPLVDGHPKFPDASHQHLDLTCQAQLVAEATFGPPEDDSVSYASPAAIGINCTSPLHLDTIVEKLANTISAIASSRERPWLVLCQSRRLRCCSFDFVCSPQPQPLTSPLADPDDGSVYDGPWLSPRPYSIRGTNPSLPLS